MRVRLTVLILVLLAAMFVTAAAQSQCKSGTDYASAGDTLFLQGDYQGAADAYSCAIEANSQDFSLYYQRSEAYYSLYDYDRALADLKRADKLVPDVPLIQFGFGRVYTAMGQPQIAIPYYDAAVSLPQDASNTDWVLTNTYGFRGLAEIDLQEYEAAIKDFSRAIERDSTWIVPLFYRAVAHANLHHYEAAIADFNRAFERLPDAGSTAFLLGDVTILASDYDNLVADLNTTTVSLQLTPRDGELLLKRGITHLQLGELDEAVSDFSAAIELDNKDAEAYYQRAQARHTKGESEAAVADYSRAIEVNADNADYYLGRSVAYQAAGDLDKAIADSTRYIDLLPDSENGYLNRGIQYSLNGDSAKAAADFMGWADRIQTQEEDGGTLTSNEPAVIEMSQGSVFRFTFDAKAGDHLQLSALPANRYITIDTLIVVLGSDGTPLAGKDDNVLQENIHDKNYDFGATIDDFEAPEDGTYTLVVTHAGGDNQGTVNVVVEPALATTGDA